MKVYLDNSATTRVYPEAAELMTKVMLEDYGNPSSMHRLGVDAEKYIKTAREQIAATLKASEKEILFTSCGTESDNLAILGYAAAHKREGHHLITTKIEHPAILNTMEHLEKEGYEVTYLDVDHEGRISLTQLRDSIREDTLLVSIMHTNNEIGALQPIEEAGALIKKCNSKTVFHVDAVQGYGKNRIIPKKMGIDMLSASGHKIHGPKGIGFLYVKNGIRLQPILFGGGQQGGLRSGTEAVPSIAGLGLASAKINEGLEQERETLYSLRDGFVKDLLTIPDVIINGREGHETAPHIVSASFRDVRAEVLLHALEDKGIYVSSGSACASNHPQTSATLLAIGVEQALLDSTIRFSFSVFTTKEELDYTVQVLKELIPVLRKFKRG
ncbi:MAG: cysteine desulfurase [Lachnospiraceae bacterium]|nr:cysteine desulfurase [Lachnospiraceae bacterium]